MKQRKRRKYLKKHEKLLEQVVAILNEVDPMSIISMAGLPDLLSRVNIGLRLRQSSAGWALEQCPFPGNRTEGYIRLLFSVSGNCA